ncbi:MAG: hypothetical protein IKA06_02315 [Clostridia bacterium]|nr:hypothetical protein [Clostridia bacterium]
MIRKKINTIPWGKSIIVIVGLLFLLFLMMSAVLFPDVIAIALLVFSLAFVLMFLHFLSNKYWNVVEISEDGVFHGKDMYKWKDVFITVKCKNPSFDRNSYDLYAFFDDHFLSDAEVDSKTVKRKGFYFILTISRTEWLLSNYHNRVKMLNENTYRGNATIINTINKHNSNL